MFDSGACYIAKVYFVFDAKIIFIWLIHFLWLSRGTSSKVYKSLTHCLRVVKTILN